MTPLETLDAFRKYLDRQKPRNTNVAFLNTLYGYVNGFEYELLTPQQEEDPRQLRLFD
jgi:hypothetical protein